MDFLFNVLIWVGVVIFAIFVIGFMAAAKLNKTQDNHNAKASAKQVREGERPSDQNR